MQKLHNINLQTTHILVSFNVVSPFTKVPLENTLEQLRQHFETSSMQLFQQALTAAYFYNGQSYKHKELPRIHHLLQSWPIST